jgi:bifunctional enzyme CysN/CysC
VSLIGIRHIIVAINKMDWVEYSEKTYNRIVEDYTEFAKQLGIDNITFIPMSAFKGDNIIDPSPKMPWYHGTTLMGYLETVEVDEERLQGTPFRLPIQWFNRPNLDFRGFSGQISGGDLIVEASSPQLWVNSLKPPSSGCMKTPLYPVEPI